MSTKYGRRALRRAVVVCALAGAWSASVPWSGQASAHTQPKPSQQKSREPARTERGAPERVAEAANVHDMQPGLAYTRGAARKPLAVFLHGMCDEPEYECPYLADGVSKSHVLICPQASLPCEGGGHIWSATKKFDTLNRAVAAASQTFSERIASGPRTLIGFSLGAIAAVDIANRQPGSYKRLLLIGAKIWPNPKRFKEGGVERVLMMAGDYDMMSAHMQHQARMLDRAGIPTRFVSTGKIGHTFPHDMNQRMELGLSWLAAVAPSPDPKDASAP